MLTSAQATAVATKVNDAYMTDSYGEQEWAKVARWLAKKGLTEREIEAVLRSKYMRWAEEGGCSLSNFKKWWNATPSITTPAEIAKLADETFGPAEADLPLPTVSRQERDLILELLDMHSEVGDGFENTMAGNLVKRIRGQQ